MKMISPKAILVVVLLISLLLIGLYFRNYFSVSQKGTEWVDVSDLCNSVSECKDILGNDVNIRCDNGICEAEAVVETHIVK